MRTAIMSLATSPPRRSPMSKRSATESVKRLSALIDVSAAKRSGTPDEVGSVGALLMDPDGGLITASDFLMDGGVTADYWYGELPPKRSASRVALTPFLLACLPEEGLNR